MKKFFPNLENKKLNLENKKPNMEKQIPCLVFKKGGIKTAYILIDPLRKSVLPIMAFIT